MDYLTQPTLLNNALTWRNIFNNNGTIFAINTNGKLFGLYNNDRWLLGSNNSEDYIINTLTEIKTIGNNSEFNDLKFFKSYIAVYKNDLTLWVWGSNIKGILGIDNMNEFIRIPTQIAGQWLYTNTSNNITLGIDKDNVLHIWGYVDEITIYKPSRFNFSNSEIEDKNIKFKKIISNYDLSNTISFIYLISMDNMLYNYG